MTSIAKYFFKFIELVFGSAIEGFFDFINGIFFHERSTEYSAEFDTPEAQLQKEPGGFRIGYKWGNSLIESNSHMIAFGGSGSKKSSCVCFNTLLQSHSSSYVVFDCSKELSATAAFMESVGYSAHWLDLDDYTRSIGINWLALCHSESEVNSGIQVLFKNTGGEGQKDYWAQSAENLAGFFAFALLYYAAPEYVNMANVLNMLEVFSYAPDRIDRWISATGDEKIINRYKSLLAVPEKTMQSTISTATNTLAIYHDPNIAAITSHNSLPFEEFRRIRNVLYVCASPSTIQYTKSIFASYFESFFGHILQQTPAPDTLNISFIIDEANTMRLSSLSQILELGRKYRISVATLWQDYNQIENIYNKNVAANILANSKLKIFLPSGQPLATCKMLSELLGKYTYEDKNGILRTRELLTPHEVFQLREILVLNGNGKPVLLEPAPYFKNSNLTKLTQMPPVNYTPPQPLSVPPLLQFIYP